MLNCNVLGLGYIGLPTAITLAKTGFIVHGVDIELEIVKNLNKGVSHFQEPGIEESLKEVLKKNTFIASLEPKESDVFIIAVPTPIYKGNHSLPKANIEYVLKAAESLSKYIKPGNIVIIESTSPVGTSEKVLKLICENSGLNESQIYLSYCPERVLPGQIFKELISNNRIIGGINIESAKKTKEIYLQFCKGKIELTDCRTAELVKLTENAFRDVNLAFANELSIVCDKLGIDVFELIKHTNLHPRVNILNPGCGVGGHCIAVDPWFIVNSAPDVTPLIQTARKVNINKTNWVINFISEKVARLEKELGRAPIIGCFGLTFKPDVEDIRESPALTIVNQLINKEYKLMICEPNLKESFSIHLFNSDKVLKEADMFILLVAHSKFKNLNFQQKIYFDFCGILQNN